MHNSVFVILMNCVISNNYGGRGGGIANGGGHLTLIACVVRSNISLRGDGGGGLFFSNGMYSTGSGGIGLIYGTQFIDNINKDVYTTLPNTLTTPSACAPGYVGFGYTDGTTVDSNSGTYYSYANSSGCIIPIPSAGPTLDPLPSPTTVPIPSPTCVPIPSPTSVPIPSPTSVPIPSPTSVPIPSPTAVPKPQPTIAPDPAPTASPVVAANAKTANVAARIEMTSSSAPTEQDQAALKALIASSLGLAEDKVAKFSVTYEEINVRRRLHATSYK